MMKVTLLLCDYAQAAEGKLNVLGGGWSIRGEHAPMSVALKLEVPWDQTNRKHTWRLWLETTDGEAVTMDSPVGVQPVEVAQDFEVGRPPGIPEGSSIDLVAAVNFGVVPLPPGSRFQWRFEVDGSTQEHWQLAFMTREVAVNPG